jgi:dihydropteroate synthase-like protein
VIVPGRPAEPIRVSRPRYLFVTGRLAESLVRRVVAEVAEQAGFDYEVAVVGISVAALMHVSLIRRRLQVPDEVEIVVVPGWVQGDLATLDETFRAKFERGPKDILDLPDHFGLGPRKKADLSAYDIAILAEINHAPRMTDAAIVEMAARFRSSGADLIDVGCIPGESWPRTGDVVRLLRSEGHRVSIDSFDQTEVEAAVEAGAELLLSTNSQNAEWASKLGIELVVIPDQPSDMDSLGRTIELLQARGTKFRIDPILEPIGFGFAASMARYYEARRRWPDLSMMMGIGNLTELSEADTSGMNLLLAGFCQELKIDSVLTTEVINWARSAVQEFDHARRLVKYACDKRTLPKHLDSSLVMLRDPRLKRLGEAELNRIASEIQDPNFRIFVEAGEIHVMNRDGHWRGRDAFDLFQAFQAKSPVDPAHAFYLGYELCKAVTALTLGKNFQQDQALRWGFLTVEEKSIHDREDAPLTP